MNSITRIVHASAFALLSLSSVAIAGGPPVNTFTITDGAAAFTLNGLIGQRTGTAGGLGDLTTQTGSAAQIDHLFQNFFWYRTTGDTREYALSNMTGAGGAGNQVGLIYSEPAVNGGVPDIIEFDVTYTLNDLSAASGRPHVLLRIDVTVRNHSINPLNVQLFSYNDMDLNGTSSNDSAAVGGSNSRYLQQITDADRHTQATYAASPSVFFYNFQMAPFPTIRTALTNNSTDILPGTPLTFGPADYTGANEWSINLAGSSSILTAQTTISVLLEVNMLPCPSDIDRTGTVNVDDLLSVITHWGSCP